MYNYLYLDEAFSRLRLSALLQFRSLLANSMFSWPESFPSEQPHLRVQTSSAQMLGHGDMGGIFLRPNRPDSTGGVRSEDLRCENPTVFSVESQR